ncbi:unnamed protein product [Litomosoides sigmodontis]|uniref:Uncharacterized protein n=1 Tax=Litomosoides sigmodontis TaxID=42156 RepID=A0A3P6SEC7_LITSI|nr:unnamed protein product [Litomosoides sigmodontis]
MLALLVMSEWDYTLLEMAKMRRCEFMVQRKLQFGINADGHHLWHVITMFLSFPVFRMPLVCYVGKRQLGVH